MPPDADDVDTVARRTAATFDKSDVDNDKDTEADAEDRSGTMNDDSVTDSTSIDRTGDDHPGGAEGNGPTDIPEESVSSESELALENQAAKRESDSEQDGK